MSMPIRTGCPDCDASSAGVCAKHARQRDANMDTRRPFPCPVCLGKGTVNQGFYEGYSTSYSTSTGYIPCRSCGGSGIVWG